jgi:type I secretion membrane fusion protein, HlyD family
MNRSVVIPPIRFDDEADAEHASTRRHSRVAAAGLLGLLGSFILAGALVPIGSAVVGSGRVGVESQVKRVAHPFGGVVAQLLVRDGSRVARGQVLLRFDTAVTGASAQYSSQSLYQLLAERAVLEAQRDAVPLRFPPQLAESHDPAAREAMAMASRRLQIKQSETSGLEAQLQQRVGQLNQQIVGFEAQIGALRRQQALIQPELEGVRKLWQRGLVTINRLNQLERTAVDLDGSIAALQASIAQTRAQISETREQMINTRQTARSEAAADLTRLLEVLNNQQVQSASATDQLQRSAVVAPASGIVDKLAVNAAGDVVRPAEPILNIVPTGDDLVVEASVSPMDIDRVSMGQTARLHFSSLNTQTTPELPGKVVRVGAERTVDERTGAQYFQVRVRIDHEALADARLPLRPGMPVEVFISTGSRSMLSYVTKPLRDQLARAFND